MQTSIGNNGKDTSATDDTPIYALPDYQIVERLLLDIKDKLIEVDAALDRIKSSRSWVPIAVNPNIGGLIYFADLGEYRYHEWQHIFTIQHLASSGAIRDYFAAPAALLDAAGLQTDTILPRGFIFHISRCGSTLMGKALARADNIGIINQPAPLQNGFWGLISRQWQDRESFDIGKNPLNTLRFKNLVHLLCQRRIANQTTVFIKFISWNSLYYNFIHSAFPDVPCLFMYRNPAEVVASVARETTAALTAKPTQQAEFLSDLDRCFIDQMDNVTYLSVCYARYFKTMLDAGSGLKLLNYENVKMQNLAAILSSAFDFVPEQKQLEQMQSQFEFYSKDDTGKIRFRTDKQEKLETLDNAQKNTINHYCQKLYEGLNRSEQNIFPAN